MASNKDVFDATFTTTAFLGGWYYGAFHHDAEIMVFSAIIFAVILYMSYLISKEKKRRKKYQRGISDIAEELKSKS